MGRDAADDVDVGATEKCGLIDDGEWFEVVCY